MNNFFHILLLEDNSDDAELIDIQLNTLDIQYELTVIETENELKKVFSEGCPDLIISDYNLQGITGDEALKMTKEKCEQLPFILVSGYLDTEEAIELMVKGASDYVLKDNLRRLGPAVKRELKSFRQFKEQQRLLESSYKLAQIGHWEIDLTENSLYWSPQIKQLHEVPQDYKPTLDEAISFYKGEENQQKIKKLIQQAINNDTSFETEMPIITAKGNQRWFRVIGDTVAIEGDVVKVFGSAQDITNRKESELQLKQTKQKLKEIVEHSTNLFYRHDTNFELTYLSPQSYKFLGCSPEEAKQNWTNFLTDHPKNERGIKFTKRAIETGQASPAYELQIRRTDGQLRWVQVNEAPVIEDGKTVAIVGALTDITKLKESHRKQEMLSMVASETQNIVIITNRSIHIEWVNDAFTRVTGYSHKEALGKNPGDLLQGPLTDQEAIDRMKRKLDKGEPFTEELINYTKKGEPYWIKLDVRPVRNSRGEIEQFFAIQEVITERKQKEERLQEQARRLQWSQEMGGIGDWAYNVETHQVFWSDMMYKLYERDISKGPPTIDEVMEYYPDQSQREYHIEKVNEAIEHGIPYDFDIKMKTDRGNIKYLHVKGYPRENENGDATKLAGIVRDITKRKQAEIDLKNKEQQLRSILDNISGMFQRYKLNPDGSDEYIFVSKGVKDLHEISTNTLKSDSQLIWDQVHSEDKQELKKSIKHSAENLTEWNHKWRIITPGGRLKWIHGRGTPRKQEDGSIIWDAIKLDITDHEQARREREELYQLIEDSLNELYVFDKETLTFVYVNSRAVENTGYAVEELAKMTPLDLKKDLSKNGFNEILSRLEKIDGNIYLETSHYRADGSSYPVEVYLTKEVYKGKSVYVANILDVSEKDKMNKRLRLLLETAPIPIFIESPDGTIIDLWNDAAEKVIGFSKEEALNKKLPHVNSSHVDEYQDLLEKVKRGHKIKGYETFRTKKNGTEFPVRINASPLFDDNNKLDSIIVTMEDITEEKQLREDLNEQVEFAKSIIDSLPGLFYMMDDNRNFIRLNENAYKLFDLEHSDLKEIDPISLVAPQEQEKVNQKIKEVIKTGYSEIETIMKTRDEERHFYINGKLIQFKGNNYIIGNGLDITEKVLSKQNNEVLLKEVHHRVKNNLAIVSGLLTLEMESNENEELRLPLQRSINRIQSMAKVHELLYNSMSFSSIKLEPYLKKMIQVVTNTIGRAHNEIDFNLDIADDIEVNINTGIPLGMLLNELITNSFKYAFDNGKGKIHIAIKKSNRQIIVHYIDNGKGIGDDFSLQNSNTLGMRIVYTLIKQLDADYKLNTKNKFDIILTFTESDKGSHSNI